MRVTGLSPARAWRRGSVAHPAAAVRTLHIVVATPSPIIPIPLAGRRTATGTCVGQQFFPRESFALRDNERANLAWFSKDDIRAVAHHSGCNQGRRILFRAIAACVGLQSQVPFPKLVWLAVRSADCVSVFAIRDCLHAIGWIELLKIRNLCATAHASHHAAHPSHWAALLSSL